LPPPHSEAKIPPFVEGPSDVFDLFLQYFDILYIKDIRWTLKKGGHVHLTMGAGAKYCKKGVKKLNTRLVL